MSLDDEQMSNRQAVILGHEADLARARADYEEQCLVESIEAREQFWVGVMEQMPQHIRDIRYGGDVTS